MATKIVSVSDLAAINKIFLRAQDRLVYQTADLSLGSLAGMATPSNGGSKAAINLDPDFQRRKRWKGDKQSALIESFLINVPVPPIYLAEDEYGQYSVVDGKQRLTAIQAFMAGGLQLTGLESLKEINGFTFSDLPVDMQNALRIRPYVRVVTLLKQSDPLLKFEVFTRLNRGGESMLDQELRKVAYRGAFSDAIFDIAEKSTILRTQLKITSESSSPFIRMEDAEYVLRFFTLAQGWKTFSGGLRDEMDEYMSANRALKGAQITKLRKQFNDTISACSGIWGQHAFQRHTGTQWRSQFLAGLFDAEMIAVYELTPAERANAISKRSAATTAMVKLFKDPDFEKSVRQGTNTPSFIRKRVNAVIDALRAL